VSSWAEDADNNTGISNENFSAEKILSQSDDGRSIVKEITEFKVHFFAAVASFHDSERTNPNTLRCSSLPGRV